MRVDGIEIGFDLLEYICFEVLFTTVFTLLTGNIIDYHESTIAPTDVLYDHVLRILVATEVAYSLHLDS